MNVTALLSALPPTTVSAATSKAPAAVGFSPATASSTVTISPEATRRYAADSWAMRQARFQEMLHGDGDPESVATVARNFAYEDNTMGGGMGGLLNMSGVFSPGGDGITRYQDGSPVTAESQAYFNTQEGRFRAERIQIFESETAKGTPPADIYDKLAAAMDQQPERYRMMMGWGVSGAA